MRESERDRQTERQRGGERKICMLIFIHTYMERVRESERDRQTERQRGGQRKIYVHIFIHTYMERQRMG